MKYSFVLGTVNLHLSFHALDSVNCQLQGMHRRD